MLAERLLGVGGRARSGMWDVDEMMRDETEFRVLL